MEKSNSARADNWIWLINLFPTAFHHHRDVCSCSCEPCSLPVKVIGQPAQTDRTRRPLCFDFIYLSHYTIFWKVTVRDAPRNCDSAHIFFKWAWFSCWCNQSTQCPSTHLILFKYLRAKFYYFSAIPSMRSTSVSFLLQWECQSRRENIRKHPLSKQRHR